MEEAATPVLPGTAEAVREKRVNGCTTASASVKSSVLMAVSMGNAALRPGVASAQVASTLLAMCSSSSSSGNGDTRARLSACRALLRLMRTKGVRGKPREACHVFTQLLLEPSAVLRRIGILLLASLSVCSHGRSIDEEEDIDIDLIHDVMMRFARGDSSTAVREAALQALVSIVRPLSIDKLAVGDREASGGLCVSTIAPMLRDESERVRLMAVRLLAMLAMRVQCDSRAQIAAPDANLTSAVFRHLLDALKDVSEKVRAEALARMGALRGVEKALLRQALGSRKQSAAKATEEDALNHRKGYQGNAATVTADAAVARMATLSHGMDFHMSDNELTGIDVANGAFVRGLEDEYVDVRMAAVDSLCELALRCTVITDDAVALLVNAVGDESSRVRLNAIRSLTKLSGVFRFSLEQIQLVVFAITDTAQEVREASHVLFGSCICGTSSGMVVMVRALVSALVTLKSAQRRSDCHNVLTALYRIGKAHVHEVANSVHVLLDCGGPMLKPEPCVDDLGHAGVLTLILSAAEEHPSLLASTPRYLPRHLRCLRDRYPDTIPNFSFVFVAANTIEVSRTTASSMVSSKEMSTYAADNMDRADVDVIQEAINGSFVAIRQAGSFVTCMNSEEQPMRDRMHDADVDVSRALDFLTQLEGQSSERHRHHITLARMQVHAFGLFLKLRARLCDAPDQRTSLPAQLLSTVQQIETVCLGMSPTHALALLELRAFAHMLRYLATPERQESMGESLIRVTEALLGDGGNSVRAGTLPRHDMLVSRATAGCGVVGPTAAIVACGIEARRLLMRIDVTSGISGMHGGGVDSSSSLHPDRPRFEFIMTVVRAVEAACATLGTTDVTAKGCKAMDDDAVFQVAEALQCYFPSVLPPSPHVRCRRADVISTCAVSRDSPAALLPGFHLFFWLRIRLFHIAQEMRGVRVRIVFEHAHGTDEVLLRPRGHRVLESTSTGDCCCSTIEAEMCVTVPSHISDAPLATSTLAPTTGLRRRQLPHATVDIVALTPAHWIDECIGGATLESDGVPRSHAHHVSLGNHMEFPITIAALKSFPSRS